MTMKREDLAYLANRGVHFDRSLNPTFVSKNIAMAMDSDTTAYGLPSNGIPPNYLTAYAQQVIEQLLIKRAYMQIGISMQMGDFWTDSVLVPVQNIIGGTAGYDDYSTEGKSTVNNTFPMRDFYLGQTNVQYGEREESQLAQAKINIVASNQYAAAQNIAIAQNRAFFFGNVNSSGVFLSKNFGLLNNPANHAFTPVIAGVQSGKIAWNDGKYSQEILQDIIAAYAILQEQLGANISTSDKLQLNLSGVASAYLNNSNTFGAEPAIVLIRKAFKNLEVVEAQEYGTIQGGSFQLIAPDAVLGGSVRDLFSFKYRAHRLVPDGSSFRQKFSFGTGGCLVAMPQAIASMSSIGC